MVPDERVYSCLNFMQKLQFRRWGSSASFFLFVVLMMLKTAEKVADIVKIVNMKMLMIDNYNEDNK